MSIPISIVLCMILTALTGTVAYLFFWFVCKFNRRTNVLHVRYRLLKIVVLAFVIPICFVLEVFTRYDRGVWTNTIFGATPMLQSIMFGITIVWVLGILVQIFRFLKRGKPYRWCIKTYHKTAKYDSVVTDKKQELGIRRKIRVKEGEYYESPFITGILFPTICMPSRNYTECELNYVILHELIHYKHKDLCMILLIRALSAVYWFHPLFFKNTLLFQYRTLLEDACDITVCNREENHEKYIVVLLSMALKNTDFRYAGPVFLSEDVSDVERRVANMKRYKNQKTGRRIVTAILMAVLFCTSTIFVYAAESGVVNGYQQLYDATWRGVEEEMNGNTSNTLEEYYEVAVLNPAITVEYVDDEISTYTNTHYVDYSIAGNTEKRKSNGHALSNGDKVLVSLTVEPSDKNVRVGFYMSNGYVRYISGSGDIYHTFTIYDDDTYYFFVQNNNSSAIEVNGYYNIR